MKNKNKRTLAKRIARTTRLCIFLAITVFFATISYMSIYLTRQNGSFFAGLFAGVIAERLSTPEFLQYLGAKDLEGVSTNAQATIKIVNTMQDFERNSFQYYLVDAGNGLIVTVPATRKLNDFMKDNQFGKHPPAPLGDASLSGMAQIRVLIDGKEVYRSDNWDKPSPGLARLMNSGEPTPLMKSLTEFFDTEASYFIPNSKGLPVAEVHVKLNSEFSLSFYVTLIFGVISAALASYAASLIITSLFTRTVAKPFVVLDKNLNYLAEGNYGELLNSHLQVRKPLKEIQSIADSTNVILDKMHESSLVITAQNELLEKQNGELEAQNEELSVSRQKIREAQTQLVQNQNMASVGQLTAAISHEINTPLGTINSNVQLQNMILDMLSAKPELARNEEVGKILDEMRQACAASAGSCGQVSLIIKSLKNFSRLDQADFQETDINESIKSVVLLTRYLWKNTITLREEYGSLPQVKCYPGLLNQVFMNILVNAIQAVRESGEITIRTWFDNGNVYASVRDNGVGIDKEKLANLFDSNYEQTNNNSGLGMSICKSIMDKHHGSIEGKSELGKGTEISIKLPVG